jgi:mono/diheme cytochrome c family protein
MKPKHVLPLLPLISLLAGCGQTPIQLGENAANSLASPALTATPLELVVYPDDRPSIPDGAPTFQQNCASCHSGGGAGGAATSNNGAGSNTTANANGANTNAANANQPANSANANASAANVSFDANWAHSVKPIDIYRLIAFGGSETDRTQRKHPAFSGKLSPRELWNCVVYVRSLGQPALTDKEISDIDPVFGSNCAVCHGTKGDGDGPLARNLDPMPANFQRFERFFNRSDDVLFDHIANGIRWEGMPNFLGKQDSAKKVHFDEAYIRKLVQYVHKFHVNNAPVLTAQNPAATASSGALGSSTGGPGGSNNPAVNTGTTSSTTTSTATGTAGGGAPTGGRRHRAR